MQKSVLTEIMLSLSKKEVRDLNKWLQSPSHNQREDVVKLFDYLSKNMERYEEAYEKAAAWKAVFSNQPYDDAFMRQVMHFLLKAIEEYLVFTDIVSDQVQFQVVLMRAYRSRKLEKSYRQALRMGRSQLENQQYRDKHYLLNKFYIEQEYSQQANIVQNASANLQETADSLERWFIAEKLQNAHAMLAHQKVYKTAKYDQGMLDEILGYIESKKLFGEPTIAAQYYAYKTITNPGEVEHFDNLEKLIHEKSTGIFTIAETRDLYLKALNYCAVKVNLGELEYCRKALKFFRSGVEKGFLLENDQITRYTFGNAVAFAIKVDEFEWAVQFIDRFKHHLDEKERNSIVNFNLSRVYFEQGDYNKAQDMLTKFEYDDMLFNIIAKSMLLKIYYEKEEFDAFESLLESMRTYLQRKEALDPARKAAYKNMISLMKKLLHLNIFSKPQKEKFKETVLKTNPLAEREWLLEQLVIR